MTTNLCCKHAAWPLRWVIASSFKIKQITQLTRGLSRFVLPGPFSFITTVGGLFRMKSILSTTIMIKQISFLLVILLLAGTACISLKKNRNTAIGTSAGVIVGGAIGGLLGKKNNNTAGGIIIGAAAGGVTGGAIGKYMDKQKRELEEKLGNSADVERVGEGIKVTFDSGLLFAFNSSDLSPGMKAQLSDFAGTLNAYDKTNILIDGHTDSKGATDYNMNLSDRRASSVNDYLKTLGVSSTRLGTRGFGESQPVASNNTENGRKQNRRVEVVIWANEDLKKQAQEGQIR